MFPRKIINNRYLGFKFLFSLIMNYANGENKISKTERKRDVTPHRQGNWM